MQRRITLKVIAEKAGVNWATVSRALNPRTASLISEDVRKRIKRISDELGYRPSCSGRSFVTGRTYKIGMILGNMRMDFSAHDWARIICGLSAEIQKRNYALTLLYANGTKSMDHQVQDFLMSGVADGYVTGPSMIAGSVRDVLDKLESPLWVVCESGASISQVNHVQRDDTEAFCSIWRRIPEECLNSMLFFGEENGGSKVRLSEILRAGAMVHPERPLKIDRMLVLRKVFYSTMQYRDARHFAMANMKEIRRHKFIWCDSDLNALGLCDALSECGCKVGKEVMVVGYGDLEDYPDAGIHATLSTISANAERIGAKLGSALMNQIEGGNSRTVKVKSTFIPRETFPVN